MPLSYRSLLEHSAVIGFDVSIIALLRLKNILSHRNGTEIVRGYLNLDFLLFFMRRRFLRSISLTEDHRLKSIHFFLCLVNSEKKKHSDRLLLLPEIYSNFLEQCILASSPAGYSQSSS